ncbi:Ig-like domain-containing protein [Pseudomonas sp. microsymbiont 2]
MRETYYRRLESRFWAHLACGMFALLLVLGMPGKTWAALPAPQMTPAPVNGVLDPGDIPGRSVRVRTLEGGQEHYGKELVLLMTDDKGAQVSRVATRVGLAPMFIELNLSKDAFLRVIGKDVKVYYTVAGVPSPSVAFKVGHGFADDFTLDLSGKLRLAFYRDGEMQLPEDGEARAPLRFTREAPGATSYQSSDSSIATVDDRGAVTALRNGQTTITAKVPSGSQSYVLTVTGLKGLEVISKQGAKAWANADGICRELQLRLPSKVELDDLKGDYPGQLRKLDLPDYPIWGGAQSAGTAWTYYARTDEVTSESRDANTLRQVACVTQ